MSNTVESCLTPSCLVNASLCGPNGLCTVCELTRKVNTQVVTFPGATLKHWDVFQPTMSREVRAGIVDVERASDLSEPNRAGVTMSELSWFQALSA